jgi:hypothetical protein
MDREWLETRIAHGVIAAAIASVGSIVVTILVGSISSPIFGFHLRHGRHRDLRLLLLELITLPIAWGVLFRQAMRWQHVWEWRRYQSELADGLKERYTITGRSTR